MKPLEKRTRPGAEARLVYGLQVLALALAYHLAARLGLKMAYVQMNTSPVWPPTGIALAALLIFGYRFWPAISLAVLAGLGRVLALGRPVLLGPSRKRFVGEVAGGLPPAERLEGTIAACVAGALAGARLFRVHDVASVQRALAVAEAIRRAP